MVSHVINTKKKISTTLCCNVTHTKKRGVTVHIYNSHIESDEDILRYFLFDKEDIEEKKELLFDIIENKTTSHEDNINTLVRFNVWSIMDLKLTFNCVNS